MTGSRDIIISYADEDAERAEQLHDALSQLFEGQLWIRKFDLNGGALIAEVLSEAYAQAKWLVLILSQASASSRWIQQEADIATFRALESDDFQIATVVFEDYQLPPHLEMLVRNRYMLDLRNYSDLEDGYLELARFINEQGATRLEHQIYEGRGADADRASLVLRKNKVVFVLGWRGIGKTAFVKHSIANVLNDRTVRVVKITPGHSLDLLARQIIHQMRVEPQPIADRESSEQKLLTMALSSLQSRAGKFYLFLDDVQYGLDGSNHLLPYLEEFLLRYRAAEVRTHILLATTRAPDIPIELADAADVFRLGTIDKEYMEEIISQWLEGTPHQESWLNRFEERAKLIDIIAGVPLAAKRMAVQIKLRSIDALLSDAHRESFQYGFADYILRTTQRNLSDLHILILEVLAVIREPVSIQDLLQVSALRNEYSVEAIQVARADLIEWFLLEQRGELMTLHDFIGTYYNRELRSKETHRSKIADEFGEYAYARANAVEEELQNTEDHRSKPDIIDLSNNIFRYAVIADRLLRTVGKEKLANQLPIRVQGTLRALVYYFYQDVEDYKTALVYSERWLHFNPKDSDIMLYRIRCLRRMGNKQAFQRARQLIEEMERVNHAPKFKVRILREKALLAQYEENNEMAKALFRDAIRIDTSWKPYSDLYSGLAKLLIKDADEIPDWMPEKIKIADEAIELLEVAKRESDNFYRFHMGAYVEALIQADRYDEAYPLLEEALEVRPRDATLHFRMAEVKRRNREFDEALLHGNMAVELGHTRSLITVANTYYDHALTLNNDWKRKEERNRLLQSAIHNIDRFLEQHPDSRTEHELEVAHTVKAKALRVQGELQAAQNELGSYKRSSNPYTVGELANLCLLRAQAAEVRSQYADALAEMDRALDYFANVQRELPLPLQTLRDQVVEKQKQCREALSL